MLSGFKAQGDLEGYLRSQNLKPFIDIDITVAKMVSFRLPEVEQLGREAKGLPADLLIEICQGLVAALQASQEEPPPIAKAFHSLPCSMWAQKQSSLGRNP